MSTPTCSYEGCNREVYRDGHFKEEGKCIFHAEHKDPQKFRDELARQIRDWRREKPQVWRFTGWVFVDVRRKQSKSVFSSDSPYNVFCHAIFPVVTDFSATTFEQNAAFEKATFLSLVSFENCKFSKVALFWSATFSGGAEFQNAEFSEEAAFSGARFLSVAVFRGARFLGRAMFGGVRFSEVAWFDDSRFNDAQFYRASFTGVADFTRAAFSQDARFTEVVFSADAHFENAMFSKIASFQNAIFRRHAYFRDVTFQSELRLYGTSFTILGDFRDVKIRGNVKLSWPGDGYWYYEKADKIDRGILCLKGLKIGSQEGEKEPLLDLRGNRLEKYCKLEIHDTEMINVLLEGTDCRQIEFHNVEWGKIGMRWAVGDEIHQPFKKRRFLQRVLFMMKVRRRHKRDLLKRVAAPWRLIAQTYQQLTLRFRRDLDHPTANDFEQGLFEMRRRAAFVGQGKWSDYPLYTIYRWLSYYSGKLWLSILWLLVTIPLFACAYYWSSTRPEVDPFWWNSLKLSVQIASLNRYGYEFAVENSIWVDIFIALQVICTATLVTLFVFAVRRRFKHGE